MPKAKPEIVPTEPKTAVNNTTEPKVEINETQQPIAKPSTFSLEKFKVKRAPTIAGVEPLQDRLSIMKIADANDFVRLHPDEDTYWSVPLCFVSVPIKGTKNDQLHLIDEEIALGYVPSKKIQRYRLALASKPYDVFFFCKVPVVNLDNAFNKTALEGCEKAKTTWVQAVSRKDQGHDDYQIIPAKNPKAFPEPKWPTQSLEELIQIAFKDCIIDYDEHPALLRLIGDKQKPGCKLGQRGAINITNVNSRALAQESARNLAADSGGAGSDDNAQIFDAQIHEA
jgi:hypothetical protein